jgi:hypothetical protein
VALLVGTVSGDAVRGSLPVCVGVDIARSMLTERFRSV